MGLERYLSRKALATLEEDLGSVPTILMVAHNCLELQFQGILMPFVTSVSTYVHMTYMQACKQSTHKPKISQSF